MKLPCVIHFLTSFTCGDSFSFWAAGYKGSIFKIGASKHAFNVTYYSSRFQPCHEFVINCNFCFCQKIPSWHVTAQQECAKSYLIFETSSNKHVIQGTRNRFLPSPAGATWCASSLLATLLQALREYPQRPRLLGIPSTLRWASLVCDLKTASQINVFAQKRLIPPQSRGTQILSYSYGKRGKLSHFTSFPSFSVIVSFTDFKEE